MKTILTAVALLTAGVLGAQTLNCDPCMLAVIWGDRQLRFHSHSKMRDAGFAHGVQTQVQMWTQSENQFRSLEIGATGTSNQYGTGSAAKDAFTGAAGLESGFASGVSAAGDVAYMSKYARVVKIDSFLNNRTQDVEFTARVQGAVSALDAAGVNYYVVFVSQDGESDGYSAGSTYSGKFTQFMNQWDARLPNAEAVGYVWPLMPEQAYPSNLNDAMTTLAAGDPRLTVLANDRQAAIESGVYWTAPVEGAIGRDFAYAAAKAFAPGGGGTPPDGGGGDPPDGGGGDPPDGGGGDPPVPTSTEYRALEAYFRVATDPNLVPRIANVAGSRQGRLAIDGPRGKLWMFDTQSDTWRDYADLIELDGDRITSGTINSARIPNLDASKITSGAFAAARIPNLDASKITSGRLNQNRLGSGTPSSGTYVDGATGAWTPLPGGSTGTPSLDQVLAQGSTTTRGATLGALYLPQSAAPFGEIRVALVNSDGRVIRSGLAAPPGETRYVTVDGGGGISTATAPDGGGAPAAQNLKSVTDVGDLTDRIRVSQNGTSTPDNLSFDATHEGLFWKGEYVFSTDGQGNNDVRNGNDFSITAPRNGVQQDLSGTTVPENGNLLFKANETSSLQGFAFEGRRMLYNGSQVLTEADVVQFKDVFLSVDRTVAGTSRQDLMYLTFPRNPNGYHFELHFIWRAGGSGVTITGEMPEGSHSQYALGTSDYGNVFAIGRETSPTGRYYIVVTGQVKPDANGDCFLNLFMQNSQDPEGLNAIVSKDTRISFRPINRL